MRILDSFRDKDLILQLAHKIKETVKNQINLMEVCGGHTNAIHKYGIPSLLPEKLNLLSGPGCPVCVTDISFIDRAIALSKQDDVIISTFGDLIRVPGSTSTLQNEKAKGAQIKIVYSPLEAVNLATNNPGKKVVFLAIGFETTAPTTACAIINACTENLQNFSVLCSHKVMPPALSALIDEGVQIDGYICPGHVTTITGTGIYDEIVTKYKRACVVSGFEPLDILRSIYMLTEQIEKQSPGIEIEYKRIVHKEGNPRALEIMADVFEPVDSWWRGLGLLAQSGLGIKQKYEQYDTEKTIPVKVEKSKEIKGCICGEILKGLKKPIDCPLFRKSCTPVNPVGACMVSHEGACQAFYKYH